MDDMNDLHQSIADAIAEAPEVVDWRDELLAATSKTTPGTPFEAVYVERLRDLKDTDPAGYQNLLAQLKKAGCNLSELKKLVSPKVPQEADDLAVALAKLAREQLEGLFLDDEGEVFAFYRVGEARETHAVESSGFHQWLTGQFFEQRKSVPRKEHTDRAIVVLQHEARTTGDIRPIFIRSAYVGNTIFLDLADKDRTIIEVTSSGWRAVTDAPIHFLRRPGMKALPRPTRDGRLTDLRRFINVATDEDFILTCAWIWAALWGAGPFPIVVASGEKGSAKSTFSQVLKELVDPHAASLLSMPKKEEDLLLSAASAHVLTFDNVSFISNGMSDVLCRVSTGGAIARRKLYTNNEVHYTQAMKPMIMNGIGEFVSRSDLTDRALFIDLEPIPEQARKTVNEFWADFQSAQPAILGALLDALVEGLGRIGTVTRNGLPRMADFALRAAACETVHWPEGTFERAYEANREKASAMALAADPVSDHVVAFMKTRGEWQGTMTELLAELREGKDGRPPDGFPIQPNRLSSTMKRLAPDLRKQGIHFSGPIKSGPKSVRLYRLERRETTVTKSALPLASDGADGTDDQIQNFSTKPEKWSIEL